MTRVAVLGMGLLGSGFAEGLLARGGSTVIVWNRTAARTAPLVALGATAADSPAEAVRGAERVHLVLLDDDSVDAAIAEFQAALHPDAVIIDHTTTQPARTAERAVRLDAAGIRYLHAPVMMGPGAARDAKGMMLVAGPSDRVAQVRDVLSMMTGEVWHVGERADLAAVYKLFGNAATLSVVGVVILRYKHPEWHRPYRTWGYPVTPLLFVGFYVWFLPTAYGLESFSAHVAAILILLGLPAYFIYAAVKRTSSA